ncbi:MAG: hypothetical protein VX380_02000, partial [Verrucomicrobiota bacterium]
DRIFQKHGLNPGISKISFKSLIGWQTLILREKRFDCVRDRRGLSPNPFSSYTLEGKRFRPTLDWSCFPKT